MKRLLVFRFSAMGDVAMTVPILYSLVKQYPELQITIVSRAAFQPFFEQLPENISFVAADLYGKHKGIRGLYRLYRELHEMKFDAVADLHNVLRTFFLRWCFRLSGIPVEHFNKDRKAKKALTRQKKKNPPSRYRLLLNDIQKYSTNWASHFPIPLQVFLKTKTLLPAPCQRTPVLKKINTGLESLLLPNTLAKPILWKKWSKL